MVLGLGVGVVGIGVVWGYCVFVFSLFGCDDEVNVLVDFDVGIMCFWFEFLVGIILEVFNDVLVIVILVDQLVDIVYYDILINYVIYFFVSVELMVLWVFIEVLYVDYVVYNVVRYFGLGFMLLIMGVMLFDYGVVMICWWGCNGQYVYLVVYFIGVYYVCVFVLVDGGCQVGVFVIGVCDEIVFGYCVCWGYCVLFVVFGIFMIFLVYYFYDVCLIGVEVQCVVVVVDFMLVQWLVDLVIC